MNPQLDPELQKYAAIDAQVVSLASDLRILSTLTWAPEHEQVFLAAWQCGQARPPEVHYPKLDFSAQIHALDRLWEQLDSDDAVATYLRESIESYRHAALLLEGLGTRAMTAHTIAIYGRPTDKVPGSKHSHLEAARHFIKTADKFWRVRDAVEPAEGISAEAMQQELQVAIDAFFTDHKVQVVLDASMTSKAAAGSKRIRLRQGSLFGNYDFNQLYQHEALVHSLTAINGNEQPYLKSLGFGSPRTTHTQEGLATFAELVTGAMDIGRLKRIALRILAVDMGLNGADFIEVFRLFLEAGQSEAESFQATARIFRGGITTGGAVFTKDSVYLSGLLTAHLFLRWSMHEKHLKWARYLFCGRLTFVDAVRLEPFFASGFIREPFYLPTWLHNEQSLAAYLAFSLFADNVPIQGARLAFKMPKAKSWRSSGAPPGQRS